MLRIPLALAASIALATVYSTTVHAQSNSKLLKDLTAVIALQGKACGRVVEADKQATNDYVVSCSDGQRYRVFVDGANRVTIKAL